MRYSLVLESVRHYSRKCHLSYLSDEMYGLSVSRSSLIAAQAGVERKDMAVVTGTRKYVGWSYA